MEAIIISYPSASVLKQYSYLKVSHINGTDWGKRERRILLLKHINFFNNQDSIKISPQSKLLLFEWSYNRGIVSLLQEGVMAVCMPEPGLIYNKPDITIANGRIFNPEKIYEILCENVSDFQRINNDIGVNIWQKISLFWDILATATEVSMKPEKFRHIIKLKREEE